MEYRPRLVDPLLAGLMTGVPAVLVVGPRGCGKTTSARRLVGEELRLDRPGDASLVRSDPDAALAVRARPLLIDEWQLVPEVLGAIKRAVDDDEGAGRFLITGSAQTDLSAAGWPLTGRAVRVPMWGLSERELVGDPMAPSFLQRIADEGPAALRRVAAPPDLPDYVARALRGGLPEVTLQVEQAWRGRRLASYVDELVARDGALADGSPDPVRLRRYLEAWAASSACVVEHQSLFAAANINRATALGYDRLLGTLMVVEELPAWTSNRLERLTSRPKRHLVEPALLGPLLGLSVQGALRDPVMLGRLIESFVLAQLRPELTLLEYPPRTYHVRDRDGRHEVDLLLEYPDGRCVGIEVKAGVTADRRDARHLIWLRDRLGGKFVLGLVLHTGPHTFEIDERILGAPVATIWS